MPGVSKEQISRAKEVGIEEYILSNEPNNVKKIGRSLYLKDHNSLEISNGLWNWHSQGIGGRTALDYIIKVRGFGFVDAVLRLTGEDYSITQPRASPKLKSASATVSERKLFVLPPRNRDNERVIAYLQSRGISRGIIQDCINRGVLYESEMWHNCVFVGRDEQGKARFAALRGTAGDFKCDANGSDKRYGFCLSHSGNAHSLAVFESPIDALSHQTLYPDYKGYRLSLGGTAQLALTCFLKAHPEISDGAACTDNDDAGNRAAEEIRDTLDEFGIANCRMRAPYGKDWNEALQQIRNEVNPLEDKRKDIIFRDSDYKEMFRIKDGDSIKVTLGYDGEIVTRKCRWIDECHTKIGSEYYHVDEYAEKSAKAGNITEPIAPGKPQIDILAAKYGETLQDVTIPMTEAALRKLVGGKFETETLYYPNQTNQFRDKIIEIKGKAFGAVLRGKDGIAVCGLTDGVLTSLHPYNAQTQKRELSPAQRAESVPDTLLGEIANAKSHVASRDSADKTAPNKAAEAR